MIFTTFGKCPVTWWFYDMVLWGGLYRSPESTVTGSFVAPPSVHQCSRARAGKGVSLVFMMIPKMIVTAVLLVSAVNFAVIVVTELARIYVYITLLSYYFKFSHRSYSFCGFPNINEGGRSRTLIFCIVFFLLWKYIYNLKNIFSMFQAHKKKIWKDLESVSTRYFQSRCTWIAFFPKLELEKT